MKQGFAFFVATITVLSMLRSANAEVLTDQFIKCFGNSDQIRRLSPGTVYECPSQTDASALFDDMKRSPYLKDHGHEVNADDRHKWGEFTGISATTDVGILNCYRYENNWDPFSHKRAKVRSSCLFHNGSVPESDEPPGAYHR
jgi:hypothetical protein